MSRTKFEIEPKITIRSSIFSRKKTVTVKHIIKDDRSAIYLILKTFLEKNALKSKGKLLDCSGSLTPPHELILIHGEAFNTPFFTRIVTPFLEFEGFSHIVYETNITSSHPEELSLNELPISLGVKLNSLKIEQTFFRPRFSRIFGKSADPVGSLKIQSSENITSIETIWTAHENAKEKALDLISSYMSDQFVLRSG